MSIQGTQEMGLSEVEWLRRKRQAWERGGALVMGTFLNRYPVPGVDREQSVCSELLTLNLNGELVSLKVGDRLQVNLPGVGNVAGEIVGYDEWSVTLREDGAAIFGGEKFLTVRHSRVLGVLSFDI